LTANAYHSHWMLTDREYCSSPYQAPAPTLLIESERKDSARLV
jgi:hypothetical protein